MSEPDLLGIANLNEWGDTAIFTDPPFASLSIDMNSRIDLAYDIVTEIRRQLPRTIVDKITVEIRSDPFHLRTQVRFKETGRPADDTRVWDCELKPQKEGSRIIACVIPDEWLARMMMECR